MGKICLVNYQAVTQIKAIFFAVSIVACSQTRSHRKGVDGFTRNGIWKMNSSHNLSLAIAWMEICQQQTHLKDRFLLSSCWCLHIFWENLLASQSWSFSCHWWCCSGHFASPMRMEFMLPIINTPTLPLFTARGLPGMLDFLFSDTAVEVLKLAWEPQSSSEPEDSSMKGTLLIWVAFWRRERRCSNQCRPFIFILSCPRGPLIASLSCLRSPKLDSLV